jgi:hypothetical protein
MSNSSLMLLLPMRHHVEVLDTVTEPPREGVRRQDQLERFLTKQEHNQHT